MSNNTPELGDMLLCDPGYLDPELPVGSWSCADPEDMLVIQINAGCLRTSAGWGALSRHERFFLQSCHVPVVCGSPEKRAIMVRELRQRLPNVILLVVEDKDFCRCNSVRDLRATCGLRAVEWVLLGAVEIPAYDLLDLADVSAPDVSKLDKVLFGVSNLGQAMGGAVIGELPVQADKGGEGKSALLGQFLLEVIDQGQPVRAYSSELPAWEFEYWAPFQTVGPENLQVRRDQLSGQEAPHPIPFAQQMIDEWWRGQFLLYDIGTSTYHDTANILRVFRYVHRRYGTKVYPMDSLMAARFRGNDRDFYRTQSEFVAKLTSFVHDNNIHVHLVAYPRKTDRVSDSDEAAGIGDVTNLADNVHVLEKEKREGRQQDSVLAILKNRFFRERGRSIGLNFERKSKRFYKSGTGNPDKVYGWALGGRRAVVNLPEGEKDPFLQAEGEYTDGEVAVGAD